MKPEALEAAMAIARQRPGYPLWSLVGAAGLTRSSDRKVRARAALKLKETLESEGFRVERDQFAGQNESPKVYPPGYQKPKKKLFTPASQQGCELTTYRVPLSELHQYIPKPAAPKPQASLIDYLPTATNWRDRPVTDAKRQHRTEQEIRAALEDAITELLAEGKPFTLRDVHRQAKTGTDTLYQTRFADLKNKAMEAIASLKARKQQQPADPTFTATLEEIESLRQRNRELRQQIAELQEQKQRPQIVEVAVPANWLRQQVEEWRDTVREIREDLEGAEKTLAAYERLLEIHHSSELDLAEVNAALNGHQHGNGNGAIAHVGGEA